MNVHHSACFPAHAAPAGRRLAGSGITLTPKFALAGNYVNVEEAVDCATRDDGRGLIGDLYGHSKRQQAIVSGTSVL